MVKLADSYFVLNSFIFLNVQFCGPHSSVLRLVCSSELRGHSYQSAGSPNDDDKLRIEHILGKCLSNPVLSLQPSCSIALWELECGSDGSPRKGLYEKMPFPLRSFLSLSRRRNFILGSCSSLLGKAEEVGSTGRGRAESLEKVCSPSHRRQL